MKDTLFSIACLTAWLLLNVATTTPAAITGHHAAVARLKAGGGAGPTIQDSNTATATGDEGLFEGPSQDWWAQKFVAGSSYTLSSVHVWMSKQNTPTGNMTAHIYSHDGTNDSPNVSLGTPSGTFDISTLSATETEETLTGMSVSITSGTTYWLVLTLDTTVANRDVLWYYNANVPGGQSRMVDNNGVGVWTTFDTTTGFKYATYGS